MMLAGGPVMSLLLTVLYGVIRSCMIGLIQHESRLYEILFTVSSFLLAFNFFQFFFTAIPIRYRIVCKGFESDGMQIVHVIREKS